MKPQILSTFTRTPLHIGSGSSVGAIDQPIQRERATGFPIIPGSSLKGSLVDLFQNDQTMEGKNFKERKKEGIVHRYFGSNTTEASRGGISISEGKVLLFPVRSLKGCFAWITSPLVIDRFLRDSGKEPWSGGKLNEETVWTTPKGNSTLAHKDQVVLEDYALNAEANEKVNALIEVLKAQIPEEAWKERLNDHLLVVSDHYMSYFCRNACEVAQHVKIDDESGTAEGGALFNQENVPSETLFYSLVQPLKSDLDLKPFVDQLNTEKVLQIGADATTGLGFCSVQMRPL